MKLHQFRVSLISLCAYQPLQEEPIMASMIDLLQHLGNLEEKSDHWVALNTLRQYSTVFHLLRQGNYRGFGDFLWDYLCYTPTHYGNLVTQQRTDPALENSARREIELLLRLCDLDCDVILDAIRPHLPLEEQYVLLELPRWSRSASFDFDQLTHFYQTEGCGQFAQHRQFLWRTGGLTPVTHSTARHYSSMMGYQLQRNQVLENTRNLILGQNAQNVLLFGDGGTGKSAVVKSMVHVPEFSRLRMIQAENDSLRTLPTLMAQLAKEPYPFVIFIDDLAFDQDDNTFSALKSILEGGLETPPQNVVIYATSNRRHLVRQTFSERAGEEVDMMETIAEKTALSQRFGLRIPYMSMDKDEYLTLVDFLYEEQRAKSSLPLLTLQELHRKAMMWEIRHGGRTPRVAGQFVVSLIQ